MHCLYLVAQLLCTFVNRRIVKAFCNILSGRHANAVYFVAQLLCTFVNRRIVKAFCNILSGRHANAPFTLLINSFAHLLTEEL